MRAAFNLRLTIDIMARHLSLLRLVMGHASKTPSGCGPGPQPLIDIRIYLN